MNPINFSFVKEQTIVIDTDSGQEEMTVLVLDKPANDQYWKKIYSFEKTLETLPEGAKPKSWKFNSSFVDLGVQDIVKSSMMAVSDSMPNISGIPIEEITGTEEPTCVLALEDGNELVNSFWK